MMNETAVYKHTAAYALEHGELEQYRASLQANIRGIYPCGEGAGYAGGITSAAMDGIRVAESLIK